MIKGSCLCGGIQFEIDGEITHSRYCHCENCRKFSGAGQAAWGLVRSADFRQTAAASAVGKFDTGTGSSRVFCATCGSPLWFEPHNLPTHLGVALGAMDEGQITAPEVHLWVRSSPAWETIAPELPHHDTVPGR